MTACVIKLSHNFALFTSSLHWFYICKLGVTKPLHASRFNSTPQLANRPRFPSPTRPAASIPLPLALPISVTSLWYIGYILIIEEIYFILFFYFYWNSNYFRPRQTLLKIDILLKFIKLQILYCMNFINDIIS